jgi:hypothetical protein
MCQMILLTLQLQKNKTLKISNLKIDINIA